MLARGCDARLSQCEGTVCTCCRLEGEFQLHRLPDTLQQYRNVGYNAGIYDAYLGVERIGPRLSLGSMMASSRAGVSIYRLIVLITQSHPPLINNCRAQQPLESVATPQLCMFDVCLFWGHDVVLWLNYTSAFACVLVDRRVCG